MLETVINKKFIDDDLEEKEICFVIESSEPLSEQVINEIEKLPLQIYWSDGRLIHWSFDTKLSCGYWLENIEYNNDLSAAKALVLN